MPSRRQILRTAALAGVALPSLAACGRVAQPRASQAVTRRANTLGSDYLALGLLALAQAHKRGWARGHHGAAVIASYYFTHEHDLDERTLRALRRQVDAFVQHRRGEFPGLDPGPGVSDVSPVLQQLDAHVHELRSGGHDAIYSSLALKALQDLPHYATPRIVDGLRRLLVDFVEKLPVVEPTAWQRAHTESPITTARELASRTLRATLRPWPSVLEVGAGQVVHWITHADALITLEELGHSAIARRAYSAHQLYIHHPQQTEQSDGPPVAQTNWLKHDYWESEAPRLPQKKTWFFGHSFKLPYSLYRLLSNDSDETRRSACLKRASQLHLPFA